MFRTLASLAAVVLALSGASVVTGNTIFKSALHDYRIVTVADGLVQPWSIAFLPDGDVLITERPGRLRVMRQGKLLPKPWRACRRCFTRRRAGCWRCMPHPNFQSNRLIYLSYSKPGATDSQATTTLVRGRFEGMALTGGRAALRGRNPGTQSFRRQDRVRPEWLPVPDARRPAGRTRRKARGASGAGPVESPRQDDPPARRWAGAD